MRFGARPIYLGEYDPAEGSPSMVLYRRLIAEWISSGYREPVAHRLAGESAEPSCRDVCLEFLDFAESHYGKAEYAQCRLALRGLTSVYGELPVSEIGLTQVRVVRDGWVRDGLARKTVNAYVGKIQRGFRWLASEGRMPASVSMSVCALKPLKKGRTEAVDHAPREPAEWADVEEFLGHPAVGPRVKALVLFMWHTGARIGEAVQLSLSSLDRSDDVWVFRPDKHKASWKGEERRIPVGPRAQEVLRPWLDRETDYLFVPREESEDLLEIWKAMSAEEREELGFHRPKPEVVTRPHFDSKRIAILLAGAGAKFTPHQLRHAFATRVRMAKGLEASRLVTGHSEESMTEHYTKAAERDAAMRLAAEMG